MLGYVGALVGLVGALVGIVASIVTVLVEREKIKWPEWAKGKKWGKVFLVFAVAGAISTGLTIGGYLIAHGTGEVEELGGMDLSGYCLTYEFDGVKDWGCETPINLGEACKEVKGDKMEFTDPDDPNSGVCVTKSGLKKGGVDLGKYCKQKYPLVRKVEAFSRPPHDWVCRTEIVPTLVCSWRYQSRDAVAREDKPNRWTCYEEKPL